MACLFVRIGERRDWPSSEPARSVRDHADRVAAGPPVLDVMVESRARLYADVAISDLIAVMLPGSHTDANREYSARADAANASTSQAEGVVPEAGESPGPPMSWRRKLRASRVR